MFSATFFIDSLQFKHKDLRVLFGLLGLFASTLVLSEIAMEKGGNLGEKAHEILKDSISIFGEIVILLALLAISFILVADISLDQIVTFITEKIKEARDKKEDEEEEITFTPGVSAEVPADTPVEIEKSKPSEPTFEIMPSLSEPLSAGKETRAALANKEITSISPTLPYADKVWELPPLELLEDAPNVAPDAGNVNARAKIIVNTLKSFGINVEVVDIKPGPSVTQYSLKTETGTKISKISALQYDLALALASPTGSVRIEAPIPGKSLIGIEVPNNNRVIVNFKSLLTSESMKAQKSKLAVVLGKDVGGQTITYDIGRMPHMLVAGATGAGKSIFLHSTIFSLLYKTTPQECKFILIDPKRVELIHYADTPHLLTPVITELDKAASAFKWAVIEMEKRYKLFESAKARNIEAYNEKSGFQALPYIIIIVDELAEMMVADPAAVEKSIIRIAQLARATGIHLVLTTQRPSTNVVTGLIKANIPCRVAFNVSSQIDSRVIIDQPGAEKLLGKGDMLFVPPDMAKPMRLQGAWVSEGEISKLVSFLKTQGVNPDYKKEVFEVSSRAEKSMAAGGEAVDELYDEAVDIVVSAKKASASLLQRRLSIGYARAARILDELEENGVVGPAQGSKPREVLTRQEMPGDMGFDDMERVAQTPSYPHSDFPE